MKIRKNSLALAAAFTGLLGGTMLDDRLATL